MRALEARQLWDSKAGSEIYTPASCQRGSSSPPQTGPSAPIRGRLHRRGCPQPRARGGTKAPRGVPGGSAGGGSAGPGCQRRPPAALLSALITASLLSPGGRRRGGRGGLPASSPGGAGGEDLGQSRGCSRDRSLDGGGGCWCTPKGEPRPPGGSPRPRWAGGCGGARPLPAPSPKLI